MRYIIIDHLETGRRVGVIVVDQSSGRAGFVAIREDAKRVLRSLIQRRFLIDTRSDDRGTVRTQVSRLDGEYTEILRMAINPPLHSIYWGDVKSENVHDALLRVWTGFGVGKMPEPETVDDIGTPIKDPFPTRFK